MSQLDDLIHEIRHFSGIITEDTWSLLERVQTEEDLWMDEFVAILWFIEEDSHAKHRIYWFFTRLEHELRTEISPAF